MKRLSVLALLTVLALALGSCDDEVSAPAESAPPIPSEIMPLALGNTWWNRMILLSPDLEGPDTTEFRQQVIQDTVVNGETWYYLVTGDTIPRKIGRWMANRAGGLYFIDRGDTTWTPILQVRYPCNAGDRYPYGDDTIVVAATDAVVQVGSHRYTAQLHSLRRDQDSVAQYFVPGLGSVLAEMFLEVDSAGGDSPDAVQMLDSALIQ